MKKNYTQMSFRYPSMTPLRGLCHVRSAGHYIVQPGFRGLPMHKDFLQLFWGVSGNGHIKYDEEELTIHPGEVFCYFPGDYHDVYAGDDQWDFFWITFDGPEVSMLIDIFGLSHTPCFADSCPIKLFEDVITSLLKIDIESEISTDIKGYEILTRASNHAPVISSDTGVASAYKKLVESEYGNQSFSIEEASSRLGLHRSSLHRVFVKECGVNPHEYLLTFRLHHACNLLATGMPIKAVASSCGFSNTNYFTKIFRKHIGKTPGAFRKI